MKNGSVRRWLATYLRDYRWLRTALRNVVFELKATWIARRARHKFRAFEGQTGLRVHLGCGYDIRPGWVNVDLITRSSAAAKAASNPDAIFINHDLRRGLSLPPGSCKEIYSSHFFEHLDINDGASLMRDCHAALAPGGVIRFVLPDFRGVVSAYLQSDRRHLDLLVPLAEPYSDATPGTATLCDVINYAVYQYGEHRCIYDPEKLIKLLRAIGFGSAEETAYSPSADPSDPLRQRYSFCVEATK